MKKYFDLLQKTGLFAGISAPALEEMLSCLRAEIRDVSKGGVVLLAGDKPRYVGVVLTGQLHITRESRDGERALLDAVMPGGIFAEALCCADVAESPVTVAAETGSAVMLIALPRILHTCPRSCAHHTRLIGNLLRLIAEKNLLLQRRMEIVGLKSVKAKVTSYLETFACAPGENIAIPFNREELADYLCVERTALSHALSRMKRGGLIDYHKNNFVLKPQK